MRPKQKKQKINAPGMLSTEMQRQLNRGSTAGKMEASAAYKSIFTSSIKNPADPRGQIFTCEAHSVSVKGNKAL